MKTIELANRGEMLDELLRQAQEEDLVLRTANGEEFLLVAVDDFDAEVARTRKNEALMAFLDQRSAEPGGIEADEVARQLGLDDE